MFLVLSNYFFRVIYCLISSAIVLTMLSQIVQAREIVATGARLGGDIFRTRLIVDMSAEVSYRTFTLSNPYRLIIDMANVRFQLPHNTGSLGQGLISSFRYGALGEGKSRMVIDLKQPAVVDKAFSIKPRQGQQGKLVIDIIPVDHGTFLAKQELARQQYLLQKAKQEKRKKLYQVSTSQSLNFGSQPEKAGERPVVVIDPGHGGIDNGATGFSGSKEKNIVLAFGKVLRDELKSRNKYTIKMTRNADIFIPLNGRVRYARQKGADLFVSIHADATQKKDPSIRGATIYTLAKKATDEESRRFAQSENASDILAGVDLAKASSTLINMLGDLARRETKHFTTAFANILVNSIRTQTLVKQNPIRSANFVVLRAPDVPSVLVELGYMTSEADEKLLKSEEWRKRVAKSVADAIDRYFEKRKFARPF